MLGKGLGQLMGGGHIAFDGGDGGLADGSDARTEAIEPIGFVEFALEKELFGLREGVVHETSLEAVGMNFEDMSHGDCFSKGNNWFR